MDFLNKVNRKQLIVYSIVVLLFFIGLLYWFNKNDSTVEKRVSPIVVRTTTATQSSHSPEIILLGQVQAKEISELSVQTPALVEKVWVNTGQSIHKSQALLKLNDKDLSYRQAQEQAEVKKLKLELKELKLNQTQQQALLDNAKDTLAINQQRLKRQEALHKDSLTSLSARDAEAEAVLTAQRKVQELQHTLEQLPIKIELSKHSLTIAQKNLELTQLDLKRLLVTAPFDGAVIRREVSTGEWVAPAQPLLTVYDKNQLQIQAKLPRKYVARLQTLQDNHQTIYAEIDETQTATTLAYIGKIVESGQLSQNAYFTLPAETTLVPGSAVLLRLQLPQVDSYAVPKASVYKNQTVYIVENQQLEPIDISVVGEITDPITQEGLQLITTQRALENKIILSQYLSNARAGLKVKAAKIS